MTQLNTAEKRTRPNVKRLQDPLIKQQYINTVETKWLNMETNRSSSIEEKMVKAKGYHTRNQSKSSWREEKAKDWLSNETLQLAGKMRKFKPLAKADSDRKKHCNYLCRCVKQSAKKDKENFINLRISEPIPEQMTVPLYTKESGY